MRILAIRGCNLASLAGEFEIDLARAPFSDAGVFAIVGNTGAGKSTLLDALCVALFDRTPRLTNHSRVVVGRGDDDPASLGAQDVRTLLRRGAAAGWAEVDFESGDARRYRARWSVRRARGQTDGTLQDQQLSLTALDGGERLGGTKTETLKAIVARLGLTFDQFRRSALLAQGEFATFLRADGKDRSELLERMTGTEIYTRLSVAAHLRAALAEQRLREGRRDADAIPVLADDARAAATAELALAEDARTAARARFAAAEAAARWRQEDRRGRTALAEAETEHVRVTDRLAASDADRAELALRRRAEQLRSVWEEATRIDRVLALAQRDATAAQEAVGRTRLAHQTITARRATLVEVHEPLRVARIAAGIVERAAAPPVAVRGAAPDHSLGVGFDAGIVARAETLARATLDDAAWLVARSGLPPEVAAWPELETRFAQHGALGDAIAGFDRTLRDHAGTKSQLVKAREVVAIDHAAGANKLTEAQRKAAGFHQRRGLTLDAARRQEDEARARLGDVERLVSIAAGARDAVRVRDQLDDQLAEHAAHAASDARQRARIEGERAMAVTLRDERVRVVEELRRAAGYEHVRTELREGEACPLCGATAHPWRDRGALDDVIGAEEGRLAEVAAAIETTTSALANLGAREHQRTKDRERLVRLRETAVTTTAADRWRDQLAALGELLLEGDPATAEAERIAGELETSARGRLETARTVFSQTQAATKAAQEAQAEVQLAQAAVDQLQALVVEHDRRLAELDATAKRLDGERAGRVERRTELEVELAAAIARWRAATTPLIDATVHAGSRTRRRAASEGPVASHAAERTGAGASRGEPGRVGIGFVVPADLTAARGAMAELVAIWRSRAERVVHADGVVADALAAIERHERDAERAATEHAARSAACTLQRDALIAELAEAVARLECARAAAGFDPEELRRLLAADPGRAEELAERIADLERASARAHAIVVERRARVEQHAAARPEPPVRADRVDVADAAADRDSTSIDQPDLEEPDRADLADADALDQLAAAVVTAEREAARLVAVLAADADARVRRDDLLAVVAAVESEAEVDRVLGAVIGSHDGKLFRSFAQSLTLDGLLAVANAHLEELAPRYQLERVPRHDLELQVVDRDLGAEVRSVQSLSGGESFLVSLALALGLSSMSAHDVRVRTLLIDEGFGTLDPATLESALSVLDALQATGRQVGVISHVPALVERVGAHVRVVQRGGGRSEVIVA